MQTWLVNWLLKQTAESYETKISIGGVNFSLFDKIVLEEILIEDQSRDTLAYIEELSLGIDTFRISNKRLHLSDILINKPLIKIWEADSTFNFDFLLEEKTPVSAKITARWKITFDDFAIRQGSLRYKNLDENPSPSQGIDLNDIAINKFNLTLVDWVQNDSTTSFFIDNASFSEKSGFLLGDLRFKARLNSEALSINNLTLIANQSKIQSPDLKINKLNNQSINSSSDTTSGGSIMAKYHIDGRLNESVLSLADFAYFIPSLWGMDEMLKFSGEIRGSLPNLKFKNLNLKVGEKSQFNADLEFMGLPDWNKTFVYCKFYDNIFNFSDFAEIKLPDSSPDRYPKIPNEDITLTYKGNFSGFRSDFVAYGTLAGDLGSLSTDIAIKPLESGEIKFSGKLNSKAFQIGKILNYEPLGAVTMHINVNGSKGANKKINAILKGAIDSIYFNNYRIDSLYIDGHANGRSYVGHLDIQDDNLKVNFVGTADLESKMPVFNFQSLVKKANLKVLGLDKNFDYSDMAFNLDANFTGKHIDDLQGKINLNNFTFKRNNKNFTIKDLKLSTYYRDSLSVLTLRSDLADIDLKGNYNFREIDLTIRDLMAKYLPSANLPFSNRKATRKNKFNFDIHVKQPAYITYFFFPQIEPQTPVLIKGNIDGEKQLLELDANIESINVAGNALSGLKIASRNKDGKWSLRIGTDKALLYNSITVDNLSLNNTLGSDSVLTTLSWNNNSDITYSGKIDAKSQFAKNQEGLYTTDIDILPSNIWVADSLWKIEPSHIHLDSTQMTVNNFKIHRNSQFFKIDGIVTDDPSDYIRMGMNKIDLGYIDLILEQKIGINAILNGEVTLSDPFHALFFTSDLKLNNFSYQGASYGDFSLENLWNKEEKRLYSTIKLLKDNTSKLLLRGYYQPNNDTLNFTGKFDQFPVVTVYPFLSAFANKLDGIATGEVQITGTIADPNFQGKVDIRDGLIGIDYTKVAYTFNEPVIFSDDSIIFRQMQLFDPEKNSAIFDGYITHKMFGQLTYNMGLQTANILALDSQLDENSMFYGKAHCSGSVGITGYRTDVKLDLDLITMPGTNIYIPLENTVSASEYDFIQFVSNTSEVTQHIPTEKKSSQDGFEMELNVQATTDAKIQLNFSSTIGDVISGQGTGNLRMIYDKLDNFYIYGNYEIDRGDYLFTLQNVIGKKFKLEQGGTISWDGDPYGAIVDLNAVYKLKASVYDLLLDVYRGDNARRIPVECKINLSKKLLNPAIKFDILFPTADERTKDELLQFISTQDDINRQILSLLVMGQFYTPDYLRSRQNAVTNTSDLVGATTSEMLSNQLSNWLSQISNSFDIGFNYKPGDLVNTNQMEIALSTQILDDRVTINGNIGNNSSLLTNTTNPFVGELEVFVKIDKMGRLQLKAYNRANDDLIYDAAPYKQGIGLSYNQSFESLYDLFRKYRRSKAKSSKDDITGKVPESDKKQ